jgi:hypothetical protein
VIVRPAAIVPLLLALAVGRAAGQGSEGAAVPKEALKELLSKALSVTISARMLPPDAAEEAPAWNAESTRLTIPGQPIRVRLEGENVRIFLACTPYLQEGGEVLLLAQGQVLLCEPPEKEARYYSSFYSIPVSYGEKVLYFPLGVDGRSPAPDGHFNIEVEIIIVPYGQKQQERER